MANVKVVEASQMKMRGYRMPQKAADIYRQKKSDEASLIRRQAADGKKVQRIAAAPKAAKKQKVAAYCRVSTRMESQESSIAAQRDHYEQYIRANDEWEYAGVYLEIGISGTKAEIRPALQRMITECKAGHVDMILTKSISRFARNTQDCLEMVRDLTRYGVTIRFEKEGVDSGTMDSEFMLTLLASFAQEESHSISGNMKWSIRKKFVTGTYSQSIAPYGYRREDGKLLVDPEQAEVVKEIFARALSGQGGKLISDELNRRGIPSAKGKTWSEVTIRQILKNPAYKGDTLYQKNYTDDHFRQRKNCGELDQYYDEGHHEAIISREDFEAAQAAMYQRAKEVGYGDGTPNNRGSRRYCFTSLLFCKACGSPMYRQKQATSSVAWTCHRHASHPDLCRMKPQSDTGLKAAFVNCLNKLAWAQRSQNPECRLLDVYERMLGRAEAEKSAERLAEIEELLSENERETRKLTAIVMRDHFLPEHREKKAFLIAQARELSKEKNRILISGRPSGALQQLKAFVHKWETAADVSAFPEEAFAKFVEKCTVSSRKMVTFHFRCGLELTESL